MLKYYYVPTSLNQQKLNKSDCTNEGEEHEKLYLIMRYIHLQGLSSSF